MWKRCLLNVVLQVVASQCGPQKSSAVESGIYDKIMVTSRYITVLGLSSTNST